MQKVLSAAILSCFFLLVLNFTFDYNRRLDFQSSKVDLADWATDIQNKCKHAQAALDQRLSKASALIIAFEARSKAEGDASETIIRLIDELSKRFDELSKLINQLEKQANAVAQEATEELRDSSLSNSVPDRVKLLDTDLEKVLEHEQSLRGRALSYEVQLAQDLSVPDNWKSPEDMIKDFEEHYNVKLTNEEWQMWRLKLGAYKGLVASANSRYMATLDSSIYERLERDGVEAYKHEKPMTDEEKRKVFASINRSNITMKFKKDEFPEIYRRGKVVDYIPHVMMDETKAFFERKGETEK